MAGRLKDSGKGRRLSGYRKRWALVIGINDYGGHHRPLRNAGNDAREFAKLLRFYGYECRELYHEQATKPAILGFLRDTLPSQLNVKDNDGVVIFFSGHGVSQAGKRGYIVPYGATASYADYVSMGELREACDTLTARHILFILDCCFSGLAAGRGVGEVIAPRVSKDLQHVHRLLSRPAWQLITAGDVDEPVADSGRNPNHSAFTYYLLQGLSGGADSTGDGLITARELEHYLYNKVYEETKDTPAPQIPFLSYINSDPERGDFVFHLPKNMLHPWVEDVVAPPRKPFQLPTLPLWIRTWQIIAAIVLLMATILALMLDFDGDGTTNYQELAGSIAQPSDPAFTATPTATSPPPTSSSTPDLDSTGQASDLDGDGLTMAEERGLGTDANKADTDGDGLNDYREAREYGTNPIRRDSDNDSLPDGLEVENGTNPNNDDTDGDGTKDNVDSEPLVPVTATQQEETTVTTSPIATFTPTSIPAPTSTSIPPAPWTPSPPPRNPFVTVTWLSPQPGERVVPDETTIVFTIEYELPGERAKLIYDLIYFNLPDCMGTAYGDDKKLEDSKEPRPSSGVVTESLPVNSSWLAPSARSVSFLVRLYEVGAASAEDYKAHNEAYSTRCYWLP